MATISTIQKQDTKYNAVLRDTKNNGCDGN